MYKPSKRSFLILAGGAGAGAMALTFAPRLLTAKTSPTSFDNSFVVPPLAQGQRQGKKIQFMLNLQQSEHHFFPDKLTPTLGVNGSYLGPVIRVNRGDEVGLQVNNQCGEPSVLHWHGLKLPAVMDGGPHQSRPSGSSWAAEFTIRQAASTCWYHSHQHRQTGPQVYRGLAGLFMIDDEVSQTLDLPSEYGVDDIPLIVQDRDFNADGSFQYVNGMPEIMHGKHGNTVLVNGVITPTLNAQRSLLRLRLINASNARIYNFAFSDNRPFHVIASDGGFLPQVASVRHLVLSPAERAEILLDVSDRQPVILKSLAGAIGGGMMGRMMGNMGFDQTMEILKINPSQAEASTHPIPIVLPQPELLNVKTAEISRPMLLNMSMGMMQQHSSSGSSSMFINGQSFDMNRVDFEVERDTPEIWTIMNASPIAHPFHIHNAQFQILDRNGKQVASHETGLKDTVLVNSGETVRLLMMFQHYSDSKHAYMYHCHNLEHEDQGMMGQFTVV